MKNFTAEFLEAVSQKNFEVIEKLFPLVSRDAHLVYMSADEFTQLHNANSARAVQYCISCGIDVNIKNPDTDETPLLTTVKLNKSPNVIRELLKQGASIEARNKHTLNTPLNQAVHFVDCLPENVLALLKHGADANTVNKYGIMPLHKACKNFIWDLTIVEQLLKCGAAVNRKNSEGLAPLSIAVKNPHCTRELVDVLLKFSAVVTLSDIRSAMITDRLDMQDIIAPLIEHACFTSAKDWESALKTVFEVLRDRKIATYGRLVIKNSFLRCKDPHQTLVISLLCYQKKAEESLERRKRRNMNDMLLAFIIQELGFDLLPIICWLKSFADNCFSEIERMKVDILSNTSIFEIITSKTRKFCPHTKLVGVFCNKTYPIYKSNILMKIVRSSLINELLSHGIYTDVQHGDVARRIVLDALSVLSIAEYLDTDDLQNLSDAFC